MTLFAKAGTEIRDENGALVATIIRDVYIGDPIGSADLVLPDGSHPIPGDLMPKAVVDFMNSKRQAA